MITVVKCALIGAGFGAIPVAPQAAGTAVAVGLFLMRPFYDALVELSDERSKPWAELGLIKINSNHRFRESAVKLS